MVERTGNTALAAGEGTAFSGRLCLSSGRAGKLCGAGDRGSSAGVHLKRGMPHTVSFLYLAKKLAFN